MTNAQKDDDFSSHSGHRERLRARYKSGGFSALADYEQIEFLLTYLLPRIDVKPTAKALLKKFGNIRGIVDAPVEELTKIAGIGETAALGISLLKNLITAYHSNELETPTNEIGTISKLIKYFKSKIASEPSEVFEMVCFDAKLRLIPSGSVRLFEGSLTCASVDVRKVIETAIKHGAAQIAIAHNHPSGVALPSPADNATTLSVFDALRTVGVELADHIIVADDDFVSLRHNGLLPERKGNGYGI